MMSEDYIDINVYHNKLSQDYIKFDKEKIYTSQDLVNKKQLLTTQLMKNINANNIADIQLQIYNLEEEIKKLNSSNDSYNNYINNTLQSVSICNSKTNSIKFKKKHSDNFILVVDKERYINNIKSTDRIINCKMCYSKENIVYIRPGVYRCNKCMYILTDVTENILVSDSDPSNINNKINIHKKKTYFTDKLKILQMTKLPKDCDSILELIKEYAKDNGIYTFNISIINKILKGLKLNNYYKFASIFLCKINGKHVPNAIGSEDIKKLMDMFSEVDQVWTVLKSNNSEYNNKSFFGFPYVLRKLIELLSDYDDYLPLIKISNSIGNINKNDQIWEIICKELNYEYIKTY